MRASAGTSSGRRWSTRRAWASARPSFATLRYAVAADRRRATGHTASDQVETILYRLVSSGRPTGIHVRRDDGVVRPLLCLWREETEAYCRAEGLPFRVDSTNADTKRGLIRDEILPLLRRLHPAAERNLLLRARGAGSPAEAARAGPRRAPRVTRRGRSGSTSAAAGWPSASTSTSGSNGPRCGSTGPVVGGAGRSSRGGPGLIVRGLAIRATGSPVAGMKVQDLFVDAKIPKSERESWPLVVRGDDVVVVPGSRRRPGLRGGGRGNEEGG